MRKSFYHILPCMNYFCVFFLCDDTMMSSFWEMSLRCPVLRTLHAKEFTCKCHRSFPYSCWNSTGNCQNRMRSTTNTRDQEPGRDSTRSARPSARPIPDNRWDKIRRSRRPRRSSRRSKTFSRQVPRKGDCSWHFHRTGRLRKKQSRIPPRDHRHSNNDRLAFHL